MPSTLDIDSDSKGIFVLFKGDSGRGKSNAALSFPTPWVADFDDKMPGIARKHFPKKAIDYDNFKTTFELQDKLNKFTKECPYETLIFDSYTSLNSLCLQTIGMAKGEEINAQIKKIMDSSKKDIETQAIDYYNGALRYTQNYFIPILKSLWLQKGNPKHIILTAHVMTVESSPDLKTKAVRRSRSIVTAGKAIAAFIPTKYDDVFYFDKLEDDIFSKEKKIKYVCTTEDVGEDDAKTSYKLPKEIDFTDKNFYDLIRSKINPSDPFKSEK